MPSFWEDDYCQIEIVPAKNREHINTVISQIEEHVRKTRAKSGFTDSFTRADLPFPLLAEQISVDHFERDLTAKGFVKAAQIRYDGDTIIDCSATTTNAFSLPSFHFFYDCKDGFINTCWMSTSLITSTDDFNKIAAVLHEYGKKHGLILIDWDSCELVELSDMTRVEAYLMGYWK